MEGKGEGEGGQRGRGAQREREGEGQQRDFNRDINVPASPAGGAAVFWWRPGGLSVQLIGRGECAVDSLKCSISIC